MEFLLKVFIGFWLIWIFWYLTGGPLRDTANKPFVTVDSTGSLQYLDSASSTKK